MTLTQQQVKSLAKLIFDNRDKIEPRSTSNIAATISIELHDIPIHVAFGSISYVLLGTKPIANYEEIIDEYWRLHDEHYEPIKDKMIQNFLDQL